MADDTPIEPPTDHVIEFTVEGKWAHFRRIDTTTVKQSYRVIPPTTLMGLIAAMLGYSRDSYYDTFSKSNAAFGIIVDNPVDPYQLAKLDLSTTGNDFESGKNKGPLKNLIARETTLDDRQQRLYEYLKNPAYRIVAAIDNDEIRADLINRLSNQEFVYTPCLGRSECIAYISDWNETRLTETRSETVDSTVPVDVAKATTDLSIERTPQRLTKEKHSRRPTSFISYSFSKSGESASVVEGTTVYSTGEDTLLFV